MKEKGVNNVKDLDFHNLIIGKTGSGKMNIPHIHLFLRSIRLENNELLLNMADKLGLGAAELSSIEHGYVPIPEGFFSKLYTLYHLPIEFGTLELWNEMEQRLYDSKLKYEKLDPVIGLAILGLIVRFESGERSSDLHAQILDLYACEVVSKMNERGGGLRDE